jgi:hypothetical protein
MHTRLAKPAVSRGLRGQRHHKGGDKGGPHDVVVLPSQCVSYYR